MKIKILFPWILAVVGLACAAAFYSSSNSKETELAALRPQAEEAAQLRDQNAELKKLQGQTAELERLRKDNEDLLQLRNEVRQLREKEKQLTGQLQTAKGQVESALSQAQNAQAQAQSAQTQAQNAQAQIQSLRATQPTGQLVGPQSQGVCINNLRLLDAAKQQWALVNKKPTGAAPSDNDIAPYLQGGAIPKCPAGGSYTINAIGAHPTCTIPGHLML
jgi:hypothetical protein